MLKVFITCDTEIWCDDWKQVDTQFPDAFRRYVYGPTSKGDYALPHILKVLGAHGLEASFFVEPLFSLRFGIAPLQELTGLILAARQEVQLHLHTEWVDEALEPVLPNQIVMRGEDRSQKRQFLYMFDTADQAILLTEGRRRLEVCGATDINAFRAGSFGLGANTFAALKKAGFAIDSSLNSSMHFEVNKYLQMAQPGMVEGVLEYPMSNFTDGHGRMRMAQIGATSFAELRAVLWGAAEAGWDSIVLLFHNFELMNQAKNQPDPVVARRFEQLCAFLAANRDSFWVGGFKNVRAPNLFNLQPPRVDWPKAPWLSTSMRVLEQARRRLYG